MEVVFPSSRNVFLNVSPFPPVETNFLFSWNIILLFRDFFLLLLETGKSNFWKATLFLLVVTDFLAC